MRGGTDHAHLVGMVGALTSRSWTHDTVNWARMPMP